MKTKTIEINPLLVDFHLSLNSSSKILELDIKENNLVVKYLDSGFEDSLDVYNVKVFVIGEKSNYYNLSSNTEFIDSYTFLGKKFYQDSYLYYFVKQVDRIKGEKDNA